MAGNTINVTVTQRDGIHTTGTPDLISAAQVVRVRDLGGTEREILLNEPKGPQLTELIVTEAFSTLKTNLSAGDLTFKEVTVVTLDEIHEVDSDNWLLNDSLIIDASEQTLRDSLGTGSRIRYDILKRAKPQIIDCLESPAAIVAGNVSA